MGLRHQEIWANYHEYLIDTVGAFFEYKHVPMMMLWVLLVVLLHLTPISPQPYLYLLLFFLVVFLLLHRTLDDDSYHLMMLLSHNL